MRRLTTVYVALIVMHFVPFCRAQPVLEHDTESTFAVRRIELASFEGEVLLHIDRSRVAEGEDFKLECLVRCTKGSAYIFNGFLSDQYTLPCNILITSIDGEIRHNLALAIKKSTLENEADAWVFLQSLQAVGFARHFIVGREAGKQDGISGQLSTIDLPAGEYYLQAVYDHSLISGHVDDCFRGKEAADREFGGEKKPLARKQKIERWRLLGVSEPVKLVVATSNRTPIAPPEVGFPLRIELRHLTTNHGNGKIQVQFTNCSRKSIEAYNPFLNPLLLWKQGYTLAILRENGTYIGDLLYSDSGSSRAPQEEDWVNLPPEGSASSTFAFRVGYVPGTEFSSKALTPGKYYLELRAFAPALSGMPAFVTASQNRTSDVNHPSYRQWLATFGGPEICGSNRVELEILPRTGD